MNASWHQNHPMPKRPTPAQRLEWHLAHQRACGCRKLTPARLEALRAQVVTSNRRPK